MLIHRLLLVIFVLAAPALSGGRDDRFGGDRRGRDDQLGGDHRSRQRQGSRNRFRGRNPFDRSDERDGCTRGRSCWPNAHEIAELRDALEPNATRLLIQTFGNDDPKISTVLRPLPNKSDEENAQPLFGLGATQMAPLYERTDLAHTCREIGLFDTDFCKAQARNAWLDKDPDFVAFPLNAAHVQRILYFAKEHNLRIDIAGAGHEFNGRNQNARSGGSILIRTVLMREKTADLADRQCLGYPSATYGAGIVVNEAQHFAKQHNKMIVTGECDSVGVVGWAIGGGHGPWSPKFGYGADNLLAVDIVLASGKHVRAQANGKYSDLFKALRGGGGSTWGIITAVTLRLQPAPEDGITYFEAVISGGVWDDNTTAMEQTISGVTAAFLPVLESSSNNVADFVFYVAQDTFWAVLTRRYVYGGPSSADAMATYQSYLDLGLPAEGIQMLSFSHPWDAQQALKQGEGLLDVLTQPQEGASSVLVQLEDASFLGDTMGRSLAACGNPCAAGFQTTLTGKAGSPQPAGTSLSAAMRTAWAWAFVMDRSAEAQSDLQATFGNGLYVNEVSPELTDKSDYGEWFWGDNYANLVATKRKYDPQSVFHCRQCVDVSE